ncbi:VRR-NUC domain-containing protein [Noviherbaspirillum sp. ST9]|uniref:VRR-NUC domain-containing protein n=1 Tax=Noviherbaspirillum sp. ST9 TaxID=3401606 RepID=UPI003B587F11
MIRTLENRFYYLDNFHTVVNWIGERYDALLDDAERGFIARFVELPQASRALLVRMVMRKGELFRSGKLLYEEIGDPREAATLLADAGWIERDAQLSLDDVFSLLTKAEIEHLFRPHIPKGARKAEQLEALRSAFGDTRPFSLWHPDTDEQVYRLRIGMLCDRLRLMFFGNLHQDWTEFVLSDLGIMRYEKVAFPASAQAFRDRRDVDDYLHLFRCRERFEAGEAMETVLADVPAHPLDNQWIEQRRTRLLFHAAQEYERARDWDNALRLYTGIRYPEARVRTVRVLELSERHDEALSLAQAAACEPESDAEQQQLQRMLPRLLRRAGQPKPSPRIPAPVARIDLLLPQPPGDYSVEELVRAQFETPDAPVWYVENTLINSLFGLLCWKAIFTPVPGAFFHPFHTGPADLHSADFRLRRTAEFDDCLSALDSERYKDIIRQYFREKSGIQSPFVFWEILDETLLETALTCIPPQHLKKWFERMLLDVRANRSGFPDLIQFWPRERRYRMVEVKAPGDRLQDNQLRWLAFCAAHGMPVEVCWVQWTDA